MLLSCASTTAAKSPVAPNGSWIPTAKSEKAAEEAPAETLADGRLGKEEPAAEEAVAEEDAEVVLPPTNRTLPPRLMIALCTPCASR